MLYLNNALASSMIPDGVGLHRAQTLSSNEAAFRLSREFQHVGNPSHAATWKVVAARLGILTVGEPQGGKVTLAEGDFLIVAEVSGLPRETREFTEAEIASATVLFRLFEAF